MSDHGRSGLWANLLFVYLLLGVGICSSACVFPTSYPLAYRESLQFPPDRKLGSLYVYVDEPEGSHLQSLNERPIYMVIEPAGYEMPLQKSLYRRSQITLRRGTSYEFRAPPGDINLTLLGSDGVMEYRAHSLSVSIAAKSANYVRVVTSSLRAIEQDDNAQAHPLELVNREQGEQAIGRRKFVDAIDCGLASDNTTILCLPPTPGHASPLPSTE